MARGEETIRFLVFKLVFTNIFRSYFPMVSEMLFLLVKKNGNSAYSVSFCPPKSITNSFNFAHSVFLAFVAGNQRSVSGNVMQVRKAKQATSLINEELQREEESYWTVFPVKFTEQIQRESICCCFKSVYVIVLRLGKTSEAHVI